MKNLKYILLKSYVCLLAFLFGGCSQTTNLISNRLRIVEEEILFPVNRCELEILKFKDGYFDTFVSLFPFRNCAEYDAVIKIDKISVFMKHDGWTLRSGDVDVYLGVPNSPMITLRAINRQKKPLLIIKTNCASNERRQEIPLRSVLLDNGGVVEIPINFKLLACNPPINGNQVKFTILSNWYENGRL